MPITEISRIATKLILKEPFYGHFLLGVPKEMSTTTDTACVALYGSTIIKLQVNLEFWQSLSEDHQYGLVKHEVLHLVFKHLFSQKNYSNKRLYNIACDLVVNQYINRAQLPNGAILLSTFDDLRHSHGLELNPFESTDYYYHKLQSIIRDNQSLSDLGNLGKLLSDDKNDQLQKHDQWYRFEELNTAKEKIMEYQLYNHVKGVLDRLKGNSFGIGSLPGKLVEYLEGFLKSYVVQVDWKRELRKFATSSNSSYIKNTLRRPSKRYGTSPGIKVKRRNKLLVVLDTSGSVPKEEIQKFFGELHQIWRSGAEVIITECDADVQSMYHYKGKVPEDINGRGGTNFDPPIVIANQQIKPDGIVYFTDGFANPPIVRSRCSILWVITSTGISKADEKNNIWHRLPGKKVKMYE